MSANNAKFSGSQKISVCSTTPFIALTEEINASFTPADRHRLIARAAFDRASRRGFIEGDEVEDWLLAEKEVDAVCALSEPVPRWDLK